MFPTLNTIEIDKSLKLHLGDVAKKFFKDLYCRPLEGKLSFINSELSVDLGYKQGLKEKADWDSKRVENQKLYA